MRTMLARWHTFRQTQLRHVRTVPLYPVRLRLFCLSGPLDDLRGPGSTSWGLSSKRAATCNHRLARQVLDCVGCGDWAEAAPAAWPQVAGHLGCYSRRWQHRICILGRVNLCVKMTCPRVFLCIMFHPQAGCYGSRVLMLTASRHKVKHVDSLINCVHRWRRTIRVWDSEGDSQVLEGHEGPVQVVGTGP